MSDPQRQARADARRRVAILSRTTLASQEHDLTPVRGAEAISLVRSLTLESWSLSGAEMPSYARSEINIKFVPRRAL